MTTTEKLNRVKQLLEEEKALEAKRIFNSIPAEENVGYYLVKGLLHQKFQQLGEAINAFSRVLELDPDNKEASANLHIIRNILNFWNPDMFNP